MRKRDRESARASVLITRELKALSTEYQKQLSKLLGSRAMRALNDIRTSRPKLTRSQKIRRSVALLKEHGVERSQILDLRRPYLRNERELMLHTTEAFPHADPSDGLCNSPWLAHNAPFGGYRWWYNWSRTSNPNNPVMTRYLEPTPGRLGSFIDTRDPDAGDDDELYAEYYTGLNVWHTPQMTGPLEIYLGFEFNVSTYSGSVADEFGFSSITYGQYALARMSATDSQNPNQKDDQDSTIFGFADFLWGEGDDWSKQVANPRDLHWYYFKTAATFYQGSPVLIEGGVLQGSWFRTNDESIWMWAIIDLRLDQIRVRSCEPETIL